MQAEPLSPQGTVRREFVNEKGNRIVITVTSGDPDREALCTSCRWRFAHNPECEFAGEPWPLIPFDDGSTLIRIEGPTSVSENYLTPLEAEELRHTLNEAKGTLK